MENDLAASYKQFCPVAMASEILCNRWTMLLLRELISGSTRFNDLRRGLTRMSPALLSQRLKDLEEAGIVKKIVSAGERSSHEYNLTEAGQDLRPVIESIGIWGQRWVDTNLSLENLDPSLLMWDIRRGLKPSPLPTTRNVIEFYFTDLPSNQKHWWLIVEPSGDVDLCYTDPGFEVELYLQTSLRSMTSIWMGYSTLSAEIKIDQLTLEGNSVMAQNMHFWLGLSPFAGEKKRV
jgi:DNA-binding HxlR family transcriptional regulator